MQALSSWVIELVQPTLPFKRGALEKRARILCWRRDGQVTYEAAEDMKEALQCLKRGDSIPADLRLSADTVEDAFRSGIIVST